MCQYFYSFSSHLSIMNTSLSIYLQRFQYFSGQKCCPSTDGSCRAHHTSPSPVLPRLRGQPMNALVVADRPPRTHLLSWNKPITDCVTTTAAYWMLTALMRMSFADLGYLLDLGARIHKIISNIPKNRRLLVSTTEKKFQYLGFVQEQQQVFASRDSLVLASNWMSNV